MRVREMGKVVAPAHTQLEETVAPRPQALPQHGTPVGRLLGVLLGRAHGRPEEGEVVVQPVERDVLWIHACLEPSCPEENQAARFFGGDARLVQGLS